MHCRQINLNVTHIAFPYENLQRFLKQWLSQPQEILTSHSNSMQVPPSISRNNLLGYPHPLTPTFASMSASSRGQSIRIPTPIHLLNKNFRRHPPELNNYINFPISQFCIKPPLSEFMTSMHPINRKPSSVYREGNEAMTTSVSN